jgi:hypothetical protein
MEQALREFAGAFPNNDFLPFAQLDFPKVLASRPVLREQAGPVL